MLQSMSSDSESEVLTQIKAALSGVKLSKESEETDDSSKMKQTIVVLRKKNIELKRRLKEVSESLISDNPNPTQEQLESMDVRSRLI
jgi:hypothetical protein